MTTYTLVDGSTVKVNDNMICYETEGTDTKILNMANGQRLEVIK